LDSVTVAPFSLFMRHHIAVVAAQTQRIY